MTTASKPSGTGAPVNMRTATAVSGTAGVVGEPAAKGPRTGNLHGPFPAKQDVLTAKPSIAELLKNGIGEGA